MDAKEKTAISDPQQPEVVALYGAIKQTRARLVGPDGAATGLPASLQEFLAKMVRVLSEGQSLSLVQNDTRLTTSEAARILGVSRQFLVGMLERGTIPHHKVGSHRRILVRDLLAWKGKRDTHRHETLDALSRAEAEDGLYDLEAPVTRGARL